MGRLRLHASLGATRFRLGPVRMVYGNASLRDLYVTRPRVDPAENRAAGGSFAGGSLQDQPCQGRREGSLAKSNQDGGSPGRGSPECNTQRSPGEPNIAQTENAETKVAPDKDESVRNSPRSWNNLCERSSGSGSCPPKVDRFRSAGVSNVAGLPGL